MKLLLSSEVLQLLTCSSRDHRIDLTAKLVLFFFLASLPFALRSVYCDGA